MEGVDLATAQRAMELAAAKLPIKTRFISRHDQEGGAL
jgi:ribosomal protein L16/L10AE